MLEEKIGDDVVVREGRLILGGAEISRFMIEERIGSGANGVVFRAQHEVLQQPRAVKVWLAARAGDTRDKVQQGINESRKMAASHPDWVGAVYDAEVVRNVF